MARVSLETERTMDTKTVDVKYDPTGDQRHGCLRIDGEILPWDDEHIVVHLRRELAKRQATHVRQVGDVDDGAVVTVAEFLREVEVVTHGFK